MGARSQTSGRRLDLRIRKSGNTVDRDALVGVGRRAKSTSFNAACPIKDPTPRTRGPSQPKGRLALMGSKRRVCGASAKITLGPNLLSTVRSQKL